MKIIAGNFFGENIQFVCDFCNCIYEVESKNDWRINYYQSFLGKCEIPEYSIECPNCKKIKYLGFDPDDLKNTEYENMFCTYIPVIKNRNDWNKRYKVSVRNEQMRSKQ